VAPVAEVLNSPAGDAGVIEVTVAPPIDAVIRISSVPSANRGVVTVLPTEPLSKATTLMSFEGYSQLAIMQGQREVRGMITWESIAKRSMLSSKPSTVADCRIDVQVIDADASLFDALPTIETYGYVLARSKDKIITGIVTATDFAAELSTLSYAFMCLRTIEMLIRNKLHPKVTPSDLVNLEAHSKARAESVRNEVMHFGPDPLDSEQKKDLNQMEHFLRQVFV
jgi:CBS domain-containing protein